MEKRKERKRDGSFLLCFYVVGEIVLYLYLKEPEKGNMKQRYKGPTTAAVWSSLEKRFRWGLFMLMLMLIALFAFFSFRRPQSEPSPPEERERERENRPRATTTTTTPVITSDVISMISGHISVM